jgi:putative iron-dependent peroxidase
MSNVQPGILSPVPRLARYLIFSLRPGSEQNRVAECLRDVGGGADIVVGIGQSSVSSLGQHIEGLRTFPHFAGSGFDVPSTPAALWCWLRGDDRGKLVHRARKVRRAVDPAYRLEKTIDAFQYGPSLDLTGYEDGTENPKGEKAAEVAIVHGQGKGLDGSSFVAVQQWVHDLDQFESMGAADRDRIIGRRLSDNEELEDAPPSAHVKRTAQESFDPEAFILRRSMPWADALQEGLVFVAFGRSFDAFEAQLKRMVGAVDGISDALFRFTHPVSGGYFWCPPVANGLLELKALGL